MASGDPWSDDAIATGPYDPSLRVNPPLRAPGDAAACLAALARRHGRRDRHRPRAAHRGRQGGRVRAGGERDQRPRDCVGRGARRGRRRAGCPCSRAIEALTTGPARRARCAGRAATARSGSSRARRRTSSSSIAPSAGRSVRTALASRGKNTPLLGMELPGRVLVTLAGGPARLRGARGLSRRARPRRRRDAGRRYARRCAPRRPDRGPDSTATTSAGRTGTRRCAPLPDPIGSAAAGHRGRRRHRRRLHGHQRGPRARPARGRRDACSRPEHARLGRIDAQRRHRPRRLQVGTAELVERYGEETGHALYRETLDGYETVKRLIADEVDRLRLP